ncbi:MAG TPA: carboxypeptidase regulatory-like domain-containing protein [Holophagaceae bacterium]|jgi:tetratricopeptide (TPR) repeat protein|nr:carboxypeptidase regulatory-like domain-containing protein [Holophagaceae bacterium]
MNRTLRALVPTLLLASASLALHAEQFDRIAGFVHTVDGKPIAGAKVVLQRLDITWRVEMTTDGKGQFSRAGIIPTSSVSYQITITKDGFAPLTQKFAMELSGDTIHKDFTMLLPGEASTGAQPGTAAPADDPAMKEDADARVAFNTAIPLYNAKQYAEALPNLEKAYKGMTDAAATMKDETAKADSQALLPTISKAYGLALHQTGKDDEAIAPLSQLVAADPKNAKNADAMLALVQIYTKKKDDANRAKYQGILNSATGTSNAAGIYSEAATAFNANHFKEAKQHLLKAVAADPSYPDSYYLLGIIEMNQGNMAGAKANFHKYIELAPNGSHAEEVKGALSAL